MRKSILMLSFLAVFSSAAFAESIDTAEVEKVYRYKGDESARAICMAIAQNQVNRLQRALRAQRINPFDRDVHERFQCNGKDLLSYSREVNADLVTQYLSPKFGTVDAALLVSSK